jgi:hypothetical protein
LVETSIAPFRPAASSAAPLFELELELELEMEMRLTSSRF